MTCQNLPPIPFLLCGNKCDLPDEKREVTEEEGKNLAAQMKIPFYECSVLKDYKCNEILFDMVRRINIYKDKSSTRIHNESATLKKRCDIL